MNFILNVMTGDDIPMIAQPSDTVERIKETVEHKYGFSPAEQVFMLGGRELKNK